MKDCFENGLMGDQPRMLGYAGLIADGRDRVECPTEKVHVYIRVWDFYESVWASRLAVLFSFGLEKAQSGKCCSTE